MAETAAKKKHYLGTGRRKTSVARVRMVDGAGKLAINGRPLENYFTETKDRNSVLAALKLTEMTSKVDVQIRVQGGGFTGQAGAICQGTARALKNMFSEAMVAEGTGEEGPAGGMVKKLRDSGYLTRDGRMKERKKYGRKGARRSFQFSKR
ncbi:MAG: 30S ribosomal protein S9 [Planctomycetes bacterium]|nr:30S ribosomal protein S9 [Planctomycetota bacterium]